MLRWGGVLLVKVTDISLIWGEGGDFVGLLAWDVKFDWVLDVRGFGRWRDGLTN